MHFIYTFFSRKIGFFLGLISLFACCLAGCEKARPLLPTEKLTETSDVSIDRRAGKPNVVIIFIDDMGYEIPTCNGGQSYSTPNMDQMALEGMRFTQCHGSPLCSPARFSFLTGKYNFRNYTEWGVMNPNEKTLATLFKSAGYATCATGKWQLNGGDTSIHSLGFDKYCVWNPYEINTYGWQGSPYKDPGIYENDGYWPEHKSAGKYGDDIFTQYVTDFIDSNKFNSFFVYYAPPLVHDPFTPTPDDPEFPSFDPDSKTSDPLFFPSMVKYVDKKIGEIIQKLKSTGLYNNTIVIVTSDNGTPREITSMYQGAPFQGGKGGSKESGTRVPLLITWPDYITPGSINNNLIDFPDFMATCAELTAADVSGYDTLDGISFLRQLTNRRYTPRSYSYTYYRPLTNAGNTTLKTWIQDTAYKYYQIKDQFFHHSIDPEETTIISRAQMTPEEKDIYFRFKRILARYPDYPTP